MFIAVWHFIVDSWRAPKRARVLYLLFAAGFVAMAVVAGVKGDALVTGIAALFALATAAVAVLVPRLAPLLGPKPVSEPEVDAQ
jgi:hypothetical protein